MGPLFIVFLFFLSFFLSFFLLLFICSFLHFLIFVFFIHFSEEKVYSFLFSCICFKYVLLLALVSEFNCFFRGRCSMEMWCPDDIRRDSWDWVGPPAWERACFNSQEWKGSSPVKTEPLQILLLLFSDTAFNNAFISTSSEHELAQTLCQVTWESDSRRLQHPPQSPRELTVVSAQKLEELALNSGTTGGARKMTQNASKTHLRCHC